ncbi:MAG: LuxR C-terminal-related transcriptional regulator [Pseudomonadota bacterium]
MTQAIVTPPNNAIAASGNAGARPMLPALKLRPQRTPRKAARSVAADLLSPGDILSETPTTSVAEGWAWFSERLARAGFESCGFLLSSNSAESPLGDPRSRLFGDVVSPEYLDFVLENPDKQAQARPYRKLRTSRQPITYLNDRDIKDATPSERALAAEVNSSFGIKAWALFPIHAPEKEQIASIGWWNLNSQEEARALWAAEESTFTLATTYFYETMRAAIDAATEGEAPLLSNREVECLLWAGAGKTTGEIAGILNVADGTVEEYFKRAAKKLGASTRAQACVRAILAGIIHP